MSMKVRVYHALTLICFFLLCLGVYPALAQERKSYAVLPFAVNGPAGYKYLEKAIPEMLSTRLYWKAHYEPVAQDEINRFGVSADSASAAKAQAALKADYIIFGSVTVVGEDASLDLKVRDKNGNVTPRSREAKVNQLIPVLKAMADAISTENFKRPPQQTAVKEPSAAPTPVNQMNPDFVVNQDTPKEVYLNPQFRYAGADSDSSRLRSQSMPFASVDMIIADVDNDSRNEVLLLTSDRLYVCRFENNQLKTLGEYKFSVSSVPLRVSVLKSYSGEAKIIVSCMDEKTPNSYILSFKDGKFTELNTRIRYFLNVMNLPPDYTPYLVAQGAARPGLFRPGVYETILNNNDVVLDRRLDLPDGANLFNITYLPGTNGSQSDSKIIMLTSNEKLRVFSNTGSRLAESDESYSGSANGIPMSVAMPGMSDDTITIPDTFYMPMRMHPTDLDHDGRYELLVNRPISTAAELFERYRFFPQSEIHSLYWDGVGMNLQWKTRRIKGSTVSYQLADLANDGTISLVVCINTHPGALGTSQRKTMLIAYPLDTSLASPNTAPHPSEMEDNSHNKRY